MPTLITIFLVAFVLFGPLRQLGHRDPERRRDSLERRPGRVGEATLDHAESRSRDAGLVSHRFLGRVPVNPQLSNRRAEGRLWLLGRSHMGTVSTSDG